MQLVEIACTQGRGEHGLGSGRKIDVAEQITKILRPRPSAVARTANVQPLALVVWRFTDHESAEPSFS